MALLTILIPAFNEEQNIPLVHQEVARLADQLQADFGLATEVLFVDDGSTDRTFELISSLADQDSRCRGLRLSRNFGSHAAIAAGLNHAAGDAAVILAADLQDPPHIVHEFVRLWLDGFHVVWGVRETRDDPLARRMFARIFYGLIRSLALPQYPKSGTGSFCLLDRCVIDALKQFPERNRVTFGLVYWAGFRQVSVSYRRQRRQAGRSKWNTARMITAALDVLLSFSYQPVRIISYLGILISLGTFLMGMAIVGLWLFRGIQTPGWASTITVVLFLGGVQLMVLGVLGEYIWRISEDSKARPIYLIMDQVGHPPETEAHD